jgi:radical SAM protein with 4Fe4S-binding SPASM domain
MKKEYINQNKELFKTFLETTFFYNWRNSTREKTALENYGSLEMSIGHTCDLHCKYCYYSRYGKELYQNKPVKAQDILANTEKLMDFIVKNNMLIKIEVFSGDPFNLPYIWEYFDIILKYCIKMPLEKRPMHISIPTNLSFLRQKDEINLNKLREYIVKFEEINVPMYLSGSVDGPFMDNFNRPSIEKFNYDKVFYDKVLKQGKEIGYGFHPMIYSNNIENWIENFLWFYYLTGNLYLLEVRNAEWTEEQSKQLYYLMKFIIHFIFAVNDKDLKKTQEFIQKNRGFNILMNSLSRVGRGLGCSIQGTLNFQMNDLSIAPCHRTSYKEFSTGNIVFKEDGSYDFNPRNVEYYIAEHATEITRTYPCVSCSVNELCPGGCLGSNYESTGDPFVQHPSMCRMEHYKIAGIIHGFDEIGLLKTFLHGQPERKKSQIDYVLKTFGERNG